MTEQLTKHLQPLEAPDRYGNAGNNWQQVVDALKLSSLIKDARFDKRELDYLAENLAGLETLCDPEAEFSFSPKTETFGSYGSPTDQWKSIQSGRPDSVTRQIYAWNRKGRDQKGYTRDMSYMSGDLREQQVSLHEVRRLVTEEERKDILGIVAEICKKVGISLPQEGIEAGSLPDISQMEGLPSGLTSFYDAARQVVEQSHKAYAEYQGHMANLQGDFLELSSLAQEAGLPMEGRLNLERERAQTLLEASYKDYHQMGRLREGVSLEAIREQIKAYREYLSSELDRKIEENLDEYRASKEGRYLPLPPEEEALSPQELTKEQLAVHVRELLRRYRHSPGVDAETLTRLRSLYESTKVPIKTNTEKHHPYKIEQIEFRNRQSLGKLLIELRKLNGYEVAESTEFDELREQIMDIEVEDNKENPIYPDEVAMIETVVRILELIDEGRIYVYPHDLTRRKDLLKNIERAVSHLIYHGGRSNVKLHYRKERTDGREAIASVINVLMEEFTQHYPWLHLPESKPWERIDWTGYPQGNPPRLSRRETEGLTPEEIETLSARREKEFFNAQKRLGPHMRREVNEAFDKVIASADNPQNRFPDMIGSLTGRDPAEIKETRSSTAADKPAVLIPTDDGQAPRDKGDQLEEVRAKLIGLASGGQKEKKAKESEQPQDATGYGRVASVKALADEQIDAEIARIQATEKPKPRDVKDLLVLQMVKALRVDSEKPLAADIIAFPIPEMIRKAENVRDANRRIPGNEAIVEEMTVDIEKLTALQERIREQIIADLTERALQTEGPQLFLVDPDAQEEFRQLFAEHIRGMDMVPEQLDSLKPFIDRTAEGIFDRRQI